MSINIGILLNVFTAHILLIKACFLSLLQCSLTAITHMRGSFLCLTYLKQGGSAEVELSYRSGHDKSLHNARREKSLCEALALIRIPLQGNRFLSLFRYIVVNFMAVSSIPWGTLVYLITHDNNESEHMAFGSDVTYIVRTSCLSPFTKICRSMSISEVPTEMGNTFNEIPNMKIFIIYFWHYGNLELWIRVLDPESLRTLDANLL